MTGRNQGLLEINSSRNTCSARGVLFLEPELTEEIFLDVLNDCCDNLIDFLAEYNKKKE